MARRRRDRVAGARQADEFHRLAEQVTMTDVKDWPDLDERWQEFIEQSVALRESYRRLSPRWRRELHPMVREGVVATVELAELMIMRRMHLRLKPIDPDADRNLVIAEFRAAMRELERLGPFMLADAEAKRLSALAGAREVDDVDLFPEEGGGLSLDRLVLLDGRVGADASHRASSR
jgi:hypothetical protein